MAFYGIITKAVIFRRGYENDETRRGEGRKWSMMRSILQKVPTVRR